MKKEFVHPSPLTQRKPLIKSSARDHFINTYRYLPIDNTVQLTVDVCVMKARRKLQKAMKDINVCDNPGKLAGLVRYFMRIKPFKLLGCITHSTMSQNTENRGDNAKVE